MFFFRRRKIREIAPEDIFLDSSNLPGHNEKQFEGRVERPVSNFAILCVGACFAFIAFVFGAQAFNLQILKGDVYADTSRKNRLDRSVIFATRGVIVDRNGIELAWNEAQTLAQSAAAGTAAAVATSSKFALRRYSDMPGLAHILGFVRYPKSDATGAWWREEYTGISGAELAFDDILQGKNGSTMIESDAVGKVERTNIVSPPRNGGEIALSIDAEIQSQLHKALSSHAARNKFQGGAGVIMDVRTGEILAIVSFPEYDIEAFADGKSDVIREAHTDSRTPLLNRAVSGLYTPGSIIKPIFAIAALSEGIISSDKKILSTGAITIPNPYDPSKPSVYRDWTVHGWVDMREAIAVSSDEYFYTIGGGHGGQRGLGIRKLDEYARIFGLGAPTGIPLLGEASGIIPTPEWKESVFGKDDPWRLGNTYHTAIGQYGFQITPLQAVRYTATIANGGNLLTPQLLASSTPQAVKLDVPDEYLKVVRDGMRMAVTSNRRDATVKALNLRSIQIAGKTGTAQTGARNQSMNSWSVGFWPADDPKYAYAAVLEKAPAGTLSGASPALVPFFQWLAVNKPQYVK